MPPIPAAPLLDPKNDYVFNRVFGESPALVVALINNLRPDLPEIAVAGRIAAWVTFFEHWREEQTMAGIEHAPIQDALNRVRQLSMDDEARRLAFVRERALHDEVSLLKEARQEGERLGLERGRQETARNLIALGALNDVQIAQVTGLSVAQVEALRAAD